MIGHHCHCWTCGDGKGCFGADSVCLAATNGTLVGGWSRAGGCWMDGVGRSTSVVIKFATTGVPQQL